MDELMRALFGLCWAWPAMAFCQRMGLKPLAATLTVTVWMTPGWWVYGRIVGRVL